MAGLGTTQRIMPNNGEKTPASVGFIESCPTADDLPTLIIDCMVGAGIEGPPRGPIAQAISALANIDVPVLAADCPSGIGSTCVLPAICTVTFQAPKIELMNCDHAGEVVVHDIGITPDAIEEVQRECFLNTPCSSQCP